MEDPEPMLIVGLPLRSDLTYAFMILIRSPGLRSSIPGKFAFSSQSFTLAVESPSYTVIVRKKKGVPSLREYCFAGERFNTRVSNEISFAPT